MYLKERKLIPSDVYELPFEVTIENKLRSFQFKLLLNIIPTNQCLWKISIKTSPQCKACNLPTETSNHKFYECPAAKSFWRDVLNWWNFKCPENITPSATEILYGYESKSSNFNAFNHHPLIAGYLIHLARLEANLRP